MRESIYLNFLYHHRIQKNSKTIKLKQKKDKETENSENANFGFQ